MIGLLPLLAAATLQAAEGPPAGWEDVHLVDWTVVSENATRDGLTLVRPSEDLGKVWIRTESRRDGRTSFVGLTEIRCNTREYRPERGYWHSGPNLSGSTRPMHPTREWSQAQPGTGSAAVLDYICSRPITLPIEPKTQ